MIKPWSDWSRTEPIDCWDCTQCGSYVPIDALEHVQGDHRLCSSCVQSRVNDLRANRPADCVWYTYDGERWRASRTRTESATLVRRAAIRSLTHMN